MTNKRKRKRSNHKGHQGRVTKPSPPPEPWKPMAYGEPAIDILAMVAANADFMPGDDGMTSIDLTLEAEEFQPFARAMMRAEAELMLEDANGHSKDCAMWRTYEQRRADAFVALIAAASDALEI